MLRSGACRLLLLALVACGESPPAAGAVELSGDVAALVNGRPITRDAMVTHARALGLLPREALAQLIRERLLADYAASRGYDRLPAVRVGIEQARVRALLAREVERAVPARDVAGRARRLEALLVQLKQATPVRFDPQGVSRALAAAPRP